MDEDFLDVTKSSNKVIAFILVTLILGLFAFGYFFVYQRHSMILLTVKHELGTELSSDVNDYLKNKVENTKEYKLNTDKVDIQTVGTYEYSITHNNKKKKGIIEIVDTTAPTFEVKSEFQVEIGNEDFYLGDVLSKCEDESTVCVVSYKNDEDEKKLEKIGTYKIKIIVSDVYKNSKETETTIKVVEKGKAENPEQKDLTYASASADLPGFKDEFYIKLTKAIKKDSEDEDTLKSEIDSDTIDEFVKTNYKDNTIKSCEIVEAYNKSNYIIGLIVKIELNNGKIIYMTKSVENKKVTE